MILTVFTRDFIPVGLIENYSSCNWTRRFRSRGECSLSVPYSIEALELLQVEHLLLKQNEKEAMMIMAVTLTKDRNGADTINVTAYSMFDLLNRRVCDRRFENPDKTAQEIIYTLIESNITDPKVEYRKLPYILLNKRERYSDLQVTEFSADIYTRLGDLIEEQLSSSGLGCVIETDTVKQTHTFDFRMPEDHTAGGDAPVIFSVDYGTLGEQEFVHSHEQYANMAYITGGDIDNDDDKDAKKAALQLIGDNLSGYDRIEVGISASDIQRKYTNENDEEVTLTIDQIKAKLIKRGEDELKNSYPEESTFSGTITETDSLVYRQDWDLGDKVTCVYDRWGVSADMVITEIREEYSRSGRRIDVTFGEGTPDFRKSLCAFVRRII